MERNRYRYISFCGCKFPTKLVTIVVGIFGILFSITILIIYPQYLAHFINDINIHKSFVIVVSCLHIWSSTMIPLGIYFNKFSFLFPSIMTYLLFGAYFLGHFIMALTTALSPNSLISTVYLGDPYEKVLLENPHFRHRFQTTFSTLAIVHLFLAQMPFTAFAIIFKNTLHMIYQQLPSRPSTPEVRQLDLYDVSPIPTYTFYDDDSFEV